MANGLLLPPPPPPPPAAAVDKPLDDNECNNAFDGGPLVLVPPLPPTAALVPEDILEEAPAASAFMDFDKIFSRDYI